MAHKYQDQAGAPEPQPPLLDYGCTSWRLSTQCVADLYHSGTKLWTKDDLVDIEKQLEQSFHLDKFILKGIDGRQIHVKNPGFGVERPIWRPYVKYRDYWYLVLCQPDGPIELSYCSYIIDWRNTVELEFRGNIEDWQELFETKRQLWNASITCKQFKAQLDKLLHYSQPSQSRKITKIICFGLGDLSLASIRVQDPPEKDMRDDAEAYSPMLQHAMALSMVDEIRKHNPNIRLISQDPQYRDDTANFLLEKGFEILGRFGASAFAEVDDESIVITAYPRAPIRQIVADMAQPAIFIATFSDHRSILSSRLRPMFDTESPRTQQMWKLYEKQPFPTSPVEFELMEGVRNLHIFSRKEAALSHLASDIATVRRE